MSAQTDEHTATTDAALSLVQAKQSVDAAHAIEQATWQFADALAVDYPEDQYPPSTAKNNHLHRALDTLYRDLLRDGLSFKVGTLREYRQTALKWERAMRIARASFTAHKALRGEEDRETIMRELADKHGGLVTEGQVKDWKAAKRSAVGATKSSPPMVSWIDGKRRSAKAWAKDAKTPAARAELAMVLRDLANDLDR